MQQPYLWPSLITPTSMTFKLYGVETITNDGLGHNMELDISGIDDMFNYDNGIPAEPMNEPFNSIRYTVDYSEKTLTITNLSFGNRYTPILYINNHIFSIPFIETGRITNTNYQDGILLTAHSISEVQATSSTISAIIGSAENEIFPVTEQYNIQRAVVNNVIQSIEPDGQFNNSRRTISGLSPGTSYSVSFERKFTDHMQIAGVSDKFEIIFRTEEEQVTTLEEPMPTINTINVTSSSSTLAISITGNNLPPSMSSISMNGTEALGVYFSTFSPAALSGATYEYTRSTNTNATLIIRGLAANTSYSFTLAMSNSSPSNFVTREGNGTTSPPEPPSSTLLNTPTGFNVTNFTATSLSFSWSPVANATGYIAVLTGIGGSTVNTATTSATFGGLTAGKIYTLSVTATSSDPNFIASAAGTTNARTQLAEPVVTVVTSTPNSITVNWSAITAEGQTVSYSVSRPGFTLSPTTSTTAELTGLEAGTSYVISVAPSAPGYTASVIGNTVPFTTPTLSIYTQNLLTSVSNNSITRNQFKAQLTANLTASRILTTNVNILKLADPTSILAGVSLPVNASLNVFSSSNGSTNSTSGIDTSKYIYFPSNPNSAIQYTVDNTNFAFDPVGNLLVGGIQRSLGYNHTFAGKTYRYVAKGSAIFEPVTVPGAPTIDSITAGDSKLIVAFTAPETDGGSAIVNYEYSTDGGQSWTPRAPSGTDSPFEITGLSNGVSYDVQLRAVNTEGPGPASNTVSGTPIQPVSPPSAPPAGEAVVPCFFGNARVLTPNGYRRMDSLVAGDMVLTPAGEHVAIERVKKYMVAASPSTNPYVIPIGQFGATKRVLISPDHKICLTDGRKVEAKKLGLTQEECDGMLTYYNLELTGQVDMVVSGVVVESLAHVRRVVVSMDQFAKLMVGKYGVDSLKPEVLAKLKRTCRFFPDGRVEVPVARR